MKREDLKNRIRQELVAIDVEASYDDMLDQRYPEMFGLLPSFILKECDPIQYRCGLRDYISEEDYYELDGLYYDQREVEDLGNIMLDENKEVE